MKLWIACFLTFGFLTLDAQSPQGLSFQELIDRGKSLRDTLPKEARHLYLAAWRISENEESGLKPWLYNEIGSLYHLNGNYDSSLFFYRKGLTTARTVSNVKEEIGGYQGLAHNFLNLSFLDSAHVYLEKAISIARQHNFYAEEAGSYSDLGNVYLDEKKLKEALSHHIKAANLYDSLVHDPVGLSKSLSNIANDHYVLGNYDKALEYVQQSIPIATEHSFLRGIAYNHKLAGRIYRQKKDLEKALKEYELAWSTYHQTGDKFNMGEVSLGIGNLHYDLGDFAKAVTAYQQGLSLSKEIASKWLMSYHYSALGFAYYALKQWKLATPYMDSTRRLASEIKNYYLVMDAYDILAEIESAQHQYKSALAYKEKYIAIKDSLTSVANRSAVEEVEAKYQNDKKSAAIELLRKDQQIQAAALARNEFIIMGIVILVVAAMIIAAFILNRFRLLNRTKQLLEMERIRNQIARDLHDDIGSTLSSINIISQVALNEDKQEKLLTAHFQRIHEHSARIMENMSDIVWSIHPGNDSMEKVVVKMKEFCGEILEPKDISYSFENADLLSGVKLDIDSRKNLFLIFKEIVNNAAKYSEAATLRIRFNKNPCGWAMDISDNGKGFDPLSVKRGNGLNNIHKRAEAMHALIKVITAPGRGTHIVVEVKDIT